MRLPTVTWAGGDRIAVLIHGLFGDARSWHRVAPALVARGYTVIACDLRGHGIADRGDYGPQLWAADLVETFPTAPDLAIGHSLGGLALGLASGELGAGRLVYLDPAWRMSREQDVASLAEWRTWLGWTSIDQLRERLAAGWPEADVQLRWESMWHTDPAVLEGLAAGTGYDHAPLAATAPSLVIAPDPSEYITEDHERELRRRGFTIARMPGSGHSAFRDDLPGVLAHLDDWMAERRAGGRGREAGRLADQASS